MMKMHIDVDERDGWVQATVEADDGAVLGMSTAPLVESATFNFHGAAVREAVEQALIVISEGV
jgi:hypothetical protein